MPTALRAAVLVVALGALGCAPLLDGATIARVGTAGRQPGVLSSPSVRPSASPLTAVVAAASPSARPSGLSSTPSTAPSVPASPAPSVSPSGGPSIAPSASPALSPAPLALVTPPAACPADTKAGGACALESPLPNGDMTISIAGNTVGDLTVGFTVTGDNVHVDGLNSLFTVHGGHAVQAVTVGPQDPNAAWHYQYHFDSIRGDFQAAPDGTLYHLPYQAGTTHRIVQGWNGAFSHQGEDALDFDFDEGTPIMAARGGLVIETRADVTQTGTDPALKDSYPVNAIYIRHDDGTVGVYLHLQHDGVEVAVGQHVETGQRIGRSGNTGYSSGPHLHFEVQGPVDAKTMRTFPALFQTRPDATEGEQPLEGQSYTAF